jgi:hypothetical protein
VYNTNPPLHFCRTSFTCLDVLDEVSAERSGLTVSVTAISSPSKREQQNKQTRPQTRKEVSTNQQTLALTRETQEAKAKRDQVTALDNSQPTSRLRPHVHVQPEEHAPKESTSLAFTCTSAAAKQQSINQTQTEIRPHVHVQPEEHAPKESTGLAFTCTSAAAKQQSINQTQTETQTTRPSTLDPSIEYRSTYNAQVRTFAVNHNPKPSKANTPPNPNPACRKSNPGKANTPPNVQPNKSNPGKPIYHPTQT